MNMDNYITCHLCKNIFLKTHVRFHYENCKNKKENNKTSMTIFPDNKKENIMKISDKYISKTYEKHTMNLSKQSGDKELFSGERS
jgi:hypothetical protein